MSDLTPTTDLVIERHFAAPPARVFRAFLDPDDLAAWFGPVGYSVPRDSVHVEPHAGGSYTMNMVSDTDPSQVSAVKAALVEVIENELIVGTEDWEVPGMQDFGTMTMRLEFHPDGDGTRLVLRQGPYTEQMEGMARDGWGSSFTKLDTLLAG